MELRLKKDLQQESPHYLFSPTEKVLLVIKKDWLAILPPLSMSILGGLIALVASTFLFTAIYPSVFMLLFLYIFTLAFVCTVLSNIILDWYFDLYVVTTQKILDIQYNPPFSFNTDSIMLDQVRCTEIDVQIKGIANEFFNKGNIVLTFDRPTNQEAFVMTDIRDPRKKALFLSTALNMSTVKRGSPTWYKNFADVSNNRIKIQFQNFISDSLMEG